MSTAPTSRRARGPQRLAVGALLGPFGALLLTVFVVPTLYAVHLSFFSTSHSGLGFGNAHTSFAGLRNYAAVLSDPSFVRGVGVTLLYAVVFIPLVLVGALALALLFDSGLIRARQLTQTVLFVPHAVPGIIATVIWLYLYTPGISPVLDALRGVDITVNFLGLTMILPSLVNIALWSGLGYTAVIFFAALKAIPRELIEAAAMDGAGPVRTALTIKVPLVRGTLTTVAIFTTIGALQLFTEPMLLAKATPLISPRYTPNMYIFDAAFTRNNYGLASAASVLLLIVCCALSFAVTRGSTRQRTRVTSSRKARP
ncbi:sugar ABC transporter permease [Streptomyces sp. ATCC51928]|uniref:Carbohydrate ABC transporter permease n=1 Tax=Streptomyces caviscabies TaxID=90079 RepID=A0ABW2M9I9_9ACTN|nr:MULTISPECIES: sugar ABC transporter permease [Streptomyces]MCL6288742.1 sugar ABC transporter permease [Streptomyces sp. 43Y-GA-1]MDX2668443.1 sugar ABC transporter permease [Streptomyces sp. NRRL_ISP-5395]MDX3502513.1 sugar ABC transporter permease [Streptomyces sp. ATCC51928]MDX5523851.1 sugar ABC transporter permease [Streptomyces sp. DE06-01C]GHF49834.1 sugar ABC transporter permease [Streptomyces griseus]